jgi:Magnesium chelatase, subunit ChlI C-terminal
MVSITHDGELKANKLCDIILWLMYGAVGRVRLYCPLDGAGRSLLRAAMQHLQMSTRTYHRILKPAPTIPDPRGERQEPELAPGLPSASPSPGEFQEISLISN